MSRITTSRNEAARINLTIDRLVLGGLEPAARSSFVEGLRSELGRVLADPATLAAIREGRSNPRRTPVLRLGQVPLQPSISGARTLGRAVARAIGRSGTIGSSGKGGRK
jgi:hypothetical protein